MSLPALPRRFTRGDTLIGIIIALGLFLILSQAVVTLAFSVYDLVSYTRARISARNIASESMEIIRNAPFDDVGTIGGIPNGIFTQEQEILRNGQSYTIRTRVVYVDDPFDGVSPIDTLPTDYKRVRVDVSWGGLAESNFSEVTMVTDIAPRGIETTAGGGTLSILVFDSEGEPVPQAEVQIVAASTVPPINTSYFTSDTGRVTLPGAPICNSCYELTVTKSGFSTDRTYGVAEIENPTKPHATILEEQLTEVSFTIDQFASLNLTTVGEAEAFPFLPNQVIRLRGDKTIGTNSLDEPVYKFDLEVVTDSAGNLIIEELEWDNYNVSLPDDSTYDIAFTNPVSPINIIPNQDVNLTISLVGDSADSLLIVFKDSEDNPIASVAATIKDGLTFEASASSGIEGSPNWGQVFFDNLATTAYTLIATASGLLEHTSVINVNEDTTQTILMSP